MKCLLVVLVLSLSLGFRAFGVGGAHCFVAESGTGIIYDYATNGSRTIFATNMGQLGGLAFDSTGSLFATDRDGYVYKISPSGSNSVFASPYNGPSGLAIDGSDNVFVGEFGNGYIFEYSPDGTRSIFGQEPAADPYYNYGRPVGLAFDHHGTLYASDEFYGYLYRGVPYLPFALVPGDPWGIAFDSHNSLFVADLANGKIYKMNSIGGIPSSSYTTFATNLNQPTGLAFDSNDNLYVADYLAGNIYAFDTNGVRTTFASGLLAPGAIAFLPAPITAAPPPLMVSLNGNNLVVLWQNSGSYTLQQNTNPAISAGWITSSFPITLANGTNRITIPTATGNLFFRLKR